MGTPIGNGDLSLRALETLQQVDLICAEDTRHTKRLTQRYEVDTSLMSCHKFNEAQRSETLITRIQNGEAIALVSDSGMPTISDPGARLVAACRVAGLFITSIPGPTARYRTGVQRTSGTGFTLSDSCPQAVVASANLNAGAIIPYRCSSMNHPTGSLNSWAKSKPISVPAYRICRA